MEKINKFFGLNNEVFNKKNLEKKRKAPKVVNKIQSYTPVKLEEEKTISFSQIQMYNECPKKWELQYKLGLQESSPSINMTFGTAMHETIQHYLDVMYNVSTVKADSIDLIEYFQVRFTETYKKELVLNKDKHFSTEDEMSEFYEDGVEILNFLKKKKGEYFSKRNYFLVGCEVPLLVRPNNAYTNVLYRGFIDIVLYHEPTEKYIIYDIKTSRNGWTKYEKEDDIKKSQLLLYKQLFAQQFEVDINKIEVEFFILRRKLWLESKWPQKRVQTFTPPNGEGKIKEARELMDKFLSECFNTDGTHKDREFSPNPTSKCKWCPYSNRVELCNKTKPK